MLPHPLRFPFRLSVLYGCLLVSHLAFAKVVINEIHYAPDVKTERAEFIELVNSGTGSVSLGGWQLAGGITYAFPNDTVLPAGGYLVIAENPATIQAKFGVTALGPWSGDSTGLLFRLSNDGDEVRLLNAAGGLEDEVNYQSGFPWPTVGDPPGYSIELIHPSFDNDLGGNWRASVRGGPQPQSVTLVAEGSGWRYFKGTSAPSTPTTAWRELSFDDRNWTLGDAPIGYDPGVPMGTRLDDMSGRYASFFVRRTFVVDDPAAFGSLRLDVMYDDGFKVWINGTNLISQDLPAGEVPYTATSTGSARETSEYAAYNLDNPRSFLRAGTNVIAFQVHNISLANSSDCFLDARLVGQAGAVNHGPTPGALNSVYATNAPPQIRQVDHSPNQPVAGEAVTISAKITDPEGVSQVALLYQALAPGNYIALEDAAYASTWTTLSMNDAGVNGDAQAGDSVYTVTLPGTLQQHRWLVRYRIRAADAAGQQITVPYTDDPAPNFAYFCYNGVPAWQGALRPGTTPVLTCDTNVMRRLPVFHLVAKQSDVESATWGGYSGDEYPWIGTLVYDGKVYDHIRYRARGGVWRYAMVKNMWKFDLNRGHRLEMRDDYGGKFKTEWSKLNLGACIQQGDYGHRGEQGMFESVGFRLFNLAGVESPHTVYTQFRVVDAPAEVDPGSQYEGDFWGLYLAVEQEDGRFLEEHGLPDGNLYKMENGTGELNNFSPLGPTDKSDLNAFLGTYRTASPAPTEEWWRSSLDLAKYWSYQAIVQGIHHYDICYDKNYFYFRNPLTDQWSVHSWDLDLTWADNMYDSGCGGVDDLYRPLFGGGGYPVKPALNLEYKNRVREIRDLLFNTEQVGQLIDECAWLLRGPTNSPTFLDADRCQWDYNPRMASSGKAGQGLFYKWPYESTVSKDFDGCIQLMKNYVVRRATVLDSLAIDGLIPAQPAVTYVGPEGYPLNQLKFRSAAYSGAQAFAAMRWRVAEVTDTNAPAYDPTERQHYEITPAWESEELNSYASDLTLPADALKVGHAYRVRVRMKDVTGRWSRWSPPVSFIAGLPDNAAALVSSLKITELMHQPTVSSDYEYIELHNSSESLTLDLVGAKFTAGIDYAFPAGITLPPGGYLLLIKAADAAAFRAHYGLASSVPLAGPYSGSLANEGEQLVLKAGGGGTEIFSFEFAKGRGWPMAAQGAGHSLVPSTSALNGQASGALDYPGNWRASSRVGGSPGRAEPQAAAPTLLLNEITAHTDYRDPLRPEHDSNDWIELYNVSGSEVNLDHWYLSDDPAVPRKWRIPAGKLAGHSWLSFDEVSGFHSPITSGFGLDKAGEQVLLSYLPGTAEDRVADAVRFKGQENEMSWGRYPDGASAWFPMSRTRSSRNTAGLPGIRISEFMYHPTDLGTNDNTRDEFVELHNPAATEAVLQDTNGVWRLSGGVSFTFPVNTRIPPGGTLLVVNFDPADSEALNTFRSVYGLTNGALQVLGPYTGKLGNRSDRIALEKPQVPDLPGDAYSWVIVDEVIYGNQMPWPANANGAGSALRRIELENSGNAPDNWQAAPPGPGNVEEPPADRDADGMPDSWESQNGLNSNDPQDAATDADGDGKSNREEYLSGTNPQDPGSVLRLSWTSTSTGGLTLRFTALADRSYTIQCSAEPGQGAWAKLTNIPAAADTRQVEIPVTSGTGTETQFYRLVTPALP